MDLIRISFLNEHNGHFESVCQMETSQTLFFEEGQ